MLLMPLFRAKILPSAVWKRLGSLLTNSPAGRRVAPAAAGKRVDLAGKRAGPVANGAPWMKAGPEAKRVSIIEGDSTAWLMITGLPVLMWNGPAAGATWWATARGRLTMRTMGSLVTL